MNGNNRRDQTIRNHYAHPLVRVVRYLRHWGGVGTPVNDAAASAIVPRLFSNSPAPARRSGKGTGELMADTNILLVEDEPSISGFVRRGLMLVRVGRYLRHWGGVGTPVNDAAASAIVPRLFSNSPAPARRSGKGTGELMADTNILLVEDEPSISGFVRRGLMFEGYEVTVVEDVRTALDLIRDTPPDLLVLDLMLPGIDGIELTRRLRAVEEEEGGRLPILMLTARDAVSDRVAGLEAGADDYLVKPFDFDELLARVRALLRRTQAAVTEARHEELSIADLTLDVASRSVRRGEREIELTPREFDLLALFMRNPNTCLLYTSDAA